MKNVDRKGENNMDMWSILLKDGIEVYGYKSDIEHWWDYENDCSSGISFSTSGVFESMNAIGDSEVTSGYAFVSFDEDGRPEEIELRLYDGNERFEYESMYFDDSDVINRYGI